MYKVSLFNNGVETIIHYPSSDKEAPHLNALPLKEGLSQVDSLSFSIYTNNPGYNNLYELTTIIKAIDTRDSTVRFAGRVLGINEQMDSGGLFFKEVLCEGVLSYFNDTKVRNAIIAANPIDFLTILLNNHNSKVDASKQVQVGNVDVTGNVSVDGAFRTSLEVLLEAKSKLGGDIRVRETNGLLYLDWLQSFSVGTIDITLGENMKDMVKGKDVTSFGTRIIPLGANNLTISSVNSGLDYIEDAVAKANFGVIEKIVEYRDIENDTELYNTALADLNKYTQPLYLLEANSLDLSYLSGNKAEQFIIGANIHLINPVMSIDSIYKVVQLDLDLLQAYDPKLTIANFPIKLSTSINDLRKSSIQNNGVYNNVQVGDAFGIRAVRSDGKVVTTLNATEGISIENDTVKVFYVDTDGTLRAVNLIGEELRTSNTDSYIILHDQYVDFFKGSKKILSLGFNNYSSSTSAEIDFYDENEQLLGAIVPQVIENWNGIALINCIAQGSFKVAGDLYVKGGGMQLSDVLGSVIINGSGITINGFKLATESYVNEVMQTHITNYHS